MTRQRTFTSLLIGAVALVFLAAPATALEGTSFSGGDVAGGGGTTTVSQPTTNPTGEVLGEVIEEGPAAGPVAGPAAAELPAAQEGQAAQEGPAAVEGLTLPITGGDVLTLAIMGLLAVGLGAILVRRGRRTTIVTA